MVYAQTLRSAASMFITAEKETRRYEREYVKYSRERRKLEEKVKRMQDRVLAACVIMFRKAERENNKREKTLVMKLKQRVIIEKTIYKQYLHSLYISKFLEYSICDNEPDTTSIAVQVSESDSDSDLVSVSDSDSDSDLVSVSGSDDGSVMLTLDMAYDENDDFRFGTPPTSPVHEPAATPRATTPIATTPRATTPRATTPILRTSSRTPKVPVISSYSLRNRRIN
jgi:hypothetical protein